jgi:hypothetical protein
MKVLLWLLREVGVQNVPSFGSLRKIQKELREDSGVPTVHWMSPKGNAFSFNDVRTLVANVSQCCQIPDYGYLHPIGLGKPIGALSSPLLSCNTTRWCCL